LWEPAFDFFFLLEAEGLASERAVDFLLLLERAEVEFVLLREPPADSTLSRLTILLKLLCSPPAVSS
jgi:hypothetical protein